MKKWSWIILFLLIFVILVVFTVTICNRLYQHELLQNENIQKLYGEINLLKNQLNMPQVEWSGTGYNYLAIGNSITRHGYADYWWDYDRGMAASSDEKDFTHIVKAFLETCYSEVNMHSVGFSIWETNYWDRAECYSVIDPFLSESVNLITLQLGENALNLDTYEADWRELIRNITDKAPNAKIIVVGDFWSYETRDMKKEQASSYFKNATFVSLEGIRDNESYYAGLGTIVEGDRKEDLHEINHAGVAKHPGDNGMREIANRIIENIKP